MHLHQAKPAALAGPQRINVVVGGDDPQPGAPLPSGQLPGHLDQRRPRPAPLLVRVQGENLALLPVLPGTYVSMPSTCPPSASATNAG
jgi:hypothetical protein